MNSPEWLPLALVEMHQVILKLQQTAPLAARSLLASQVVLHPALRLKLNAACGVLLKHHAHDVDLLDELRQQAMLLLIERLTAGNLAYRDEGPDRFGGWLYRVCRSICSDALVSCLSSCRQSIVLVDNQQLAQCTARLEVEHRLDMMLRGIDAIRLPLVRVIMLEAASPTGMTLDDSARLHGLSRSAVFRLRRKGIVLVRRFLQEELADAH